MGITSFLLEHATGFIIAFGTITAAYISKLEFAHIFPIRGRKPSVDGEWFGVSIYIPLTHFNSGSECIYDVELTLTHKGRDKYSLTEVIPRAYDADGNIVDINKTRKITGKGRRVSNREFLFDFHESDSDTCGTIYLFADTRYEQMSGFVSLKNPKQELPLTNQVLLTRKGGKKITPEDLCLKAVRCLISMHTERSS